MMEGFIINYSPGYTKEDRETWGYPVPYPYPIFGLRLSRGEIIHGSMTHSTKRRRSLFVWYSGIKENHEELEMKGILS